MASRAVFEVSSGDRLAITLIEYEKNDPSKGDYLSFEAEVKSGAFSGLTRFWVSKHALMGFIEELTELSGRLSGEASIECGWGTDVYFSLRLFAYDHLGHLGAAVEAATPPSGRQRSMSRVSTELEVEPLMVEAFLQSLRAFVRGA